jgi:hypothetical protein
VVFEGQIQLRSGADSVLDPSIGEVVLDLHDFIEELAVLLSAEEELELMSILNTIDLLLGQLCLLGNLLHHLILFAQH